MNTPRIISLLIVLLTPALAEVQTSAESERSGTEAHRWRVGATGQAGEVVVLRWSRTWTVGQTKHVSTHDTVSYDPGERIEGVFAAIYDKSKRQWLIEPFGSSGWLDGQYVDSSQGDNSGTIRFKNSRGQTYEYTFSAFVMAYQKAIALYDGLPDVSTAGWTWAGEPKQGEQDKSSVRGKPRR